MSAFNPPAIFDFPPFFTLQPVDASKHRQLEEWRALVLSWAQATRTSTIAVATWPLWENARIQRRLGPEGIAAVVDHLIARGSAEWADAAKTSLRLFYRSPAEWATMLYDYAHKYGYAGQLLTVYELHSGAPALGQPWEGLEPAVLLRALETLESKGKAAIFRAEGTVDETAVKIM